jgi:hypothetical protein
MPVCYLVSASKPFQEFSYNNIRKMFLKVAAQFDFRPYESIIKLIFLKVLISTYDKIKEDEMGKAYSTHVETAGIYT